MPRKKETPIMATSQNGWYAFTSYSNSNLRNLSWVSGSVNKSCHEIFEMFCADFNAQVERIHVGSSWGFAPREIRGSSTQLSNHASGTAVDLNAPNHGLGRKGTFNGAQVHAIQSLLKKYGHAIRWGGNYPGRKDEMHFEINTDPKRVAAVVASLKKGGTVRPAGRPSKPAAKPKPKGTDKNRSIQTALTTMGLYKGLIDGRNQSMQKAAVKEFQGFHGLVEDGKWQAKTQAVFTLNKRVQQALIDQGYTKQTVDGYYGDQTAANVGDFQARVGLKVDKLAGPVTQKRLGI